ncbi:MAG: transporter substrate-binding domain-containing protein [Chloroflexi bacterium]|nr:transporter substrate-binding domain-containing protein [Chloroflexota bacterium]
MHNRDQSTVRAIVVCAGLLVALGFVITVPVTSSPSAGQPAPTLVPPTLVPTPEQAMLDVLPSESAVARIQRDGVVRVGVLYTAPPFGDFNARGEPSGFDPDLARAFAEVWGVEVEFVQATRQTGIDLVTSGAIDLLIAAQPHLREYDPYVEFSHTYYPANQVIAVRQGDGATALGHMAERVVGVVMGTRGELAVDDWLSRVDYPVNVRRYFTLDSALAALHTADDGLRLDGVIASRVRLERAINPAEVRFVAEPVMLEPYAIALPRQDVNLRNLVNRTLQYLLRSGRLDEIHRDHFENAAYPRGVLIPWLNVGDDPPQIDQVAADMPFPQQYTVPRLQTAGRLRVAGVRELPPDAPESAQRADALNRALINELARRWNVTVEFVPDSGDDAFEFVAQGQADLAVGVQPNWAFTDRVDFTSPYLIHGIRLMIRADDNINGWGDLRGATIGIFATEPGVSAIIRQQADAANAIIDDIFTLTNEADAAFAMLNDGTAEILLGAVLGDSLKLAIHIERNPDALTLLTNSGSPIWYTRNYVALATPRNDLDFRLLVEYTLQEIVRDGTMQALLAPVMLPSDLPQFDVWPGSGTYLGFDLRR